jgi:hypothetical protein
MKKGTDCREAIVALDGLEPLTLYAIDDVIIVKQGRETILLRAAAASQLATTLTRLAHKDVDQRATCGTLTDDGLNGEFDD